MIYPSFDEFMQMEVEKKAELIDNSIFSIDTPLWLTLLMTAAEHNSPTPLFISKTLTEIFREYLEFKNAK